MKIRTVYVYYACFLHLEESKINHLKTAHQCLVNAHHATSVVEFPAIVGRGKQCDQLTLGKKLVPVLDHLMRSAYQIHIVTIQELGHDVRTKCERDTSVIFAPTLKQRRCGYRSVAFRCTRRDVRLT